jgi:hypothetical protein
MARPGFRSHRKFRRLVAELGIAEALALGSIEMIWESVYQAGDPLLGDSLSVEALAGWPADRRGELCRALVECGGEGEAGLIEPDPDRPNFFRVHDLMDHAPEFVRDRRRKEIERREKGIQPRPPGKATQDSASVLEVPGSSRIRPAESSTPSPAPAPTPTPTPKKKGRTRAADFSEFWKVYPKKAGKVEAEKAWTNLSDEERVKAMAAAPIYAAAMADRPNFIKNAQGWLNGKRFDDDPETWKSRNGTGGKPRGTAATWSGRPGDSPTMPNYPKGTPFPGDDDEEPEGTPWRADLLAEVEGAMKKTDARDPLSERENLLLGLWLAKGPAPELDGIEALLEAERESQAEVERMVG